MTRTVATSIQKQNVEALLSNLDLSKPTLLCSFIKYAHLASVASGWWHDIHNGELLFRNRAELLMLIVSEISETMEGERKGLMDDKLKHRPMAEVELADACIRIFDYACACGYDLEGAILEKMKFNLQREDHKIETRKRDGGKVF